MNKADTNLAALGVSVLSAQEFGAIGRLLNKC